MREIVDGVPEFINRSPASKLEMFLDNPLLLLKNKRTHESIRLCTHLPYSLSA
jgi:hypothetical protein